MTISRLEPLDHFLELTHCSLRTRSQCVDGADYFGPHVDLALSIVIHCVPLVIRLVYFLKADSLATRRI